jgi:hypothetical protein
MGLDTSHDAFHGAYSAFNRLRQEVASAIGGSYPPHYLRAYDGKIAEGKNGSLIVDYTLDPERFYTPDEVTQESHPGLWEFLTHSDCDGAIAPDMCAKVADDLEPLLDKMPEGGAGHIGARGGFREVLRKFIAGCRAAHAEGVPLDFH